MGAKLFLRIPKHLHSSELHDGFPLKTCNFIYMYSKWVYFYDNIFVIKATPLNKLTCMRKCHRGARKV